MRDFWTVLGRAVVDQPFYEKLKRRAVYRPDDKPKRPNREDLVTLQRWVRARSAGRLLLDRGETWLLHRLIATVSKSRLRFAQQAWRRHYKSAGTSFREDAGPLAAAGLCCVDTEFREEVMEHSAEGAEALLGCLEGHAVPDSACFEVDMSQAERLSRFFPDKKGRNSVTQAFKEVDRKWIEPGRCEPAYSISRDWWPTSSEIVSREKLRAIQRAVGGSKGGAMRQAFATFLSADATDPKFKEFLEELKRSHPRSGQPRGTAGATVLKCFG